ncbi:hypothetical protein [Mycobacteroides abscessus]|uniref:hypothetical protein n=1 Tax=Mycobacteroides abscessus TaxID=36809 RepID=UPI000929BC71|nr:hypothetical protein [Mycobacteroides abscessus]SIF35314.1 Uncharacterised protein [Mycobacteroides abscessus subsp. abscessus]
MTNIDQPYGDEERARDLARLRALTRKLKRQQDTLNATSAERVSVIRRLRTLGGATYPMLAEAMGTTYSAVQRLLEKLDRDRNK